MGTLSVGSILSASLAHWRRNLGSLTLLAAALELPLVLAEVVLHVSPGVRDFLDGTLVVTRGLLVVIVYGALSHHFLAGLLERLVSAERHGHDEPGLRDVLRDLPWWRLFLADLLLSTLILVGLAAFVVPGLLVLTWFAVVLPIVNLERRSVVASFARSYRLVRGHFWRVALVSVAAFAVPEMIIGFVGEVTHTGHVVVDAVAHAVPAVLLLPLAALPIVVMTFDLVGLDALASAPPTRTGPT